jgi:maleate isomerase
MADTLAPRGLIGVMTPAMNSVVQPELELLRPQGVTNQMQRFRLGGDRISEDLLAEAEKLMDCRPMALAIGLTTDAGPGGVAKLAARTRELTERLGIPVCNASAANHAALRALGAAKVAVVTPFDAAVDRNVQANVEEAGFQVASIKGTEAPSLPAICETHLEDIRRVFLTVAEADCEAILQVGTALPVVAEIAALERETGRPIVACNAAVYWQALRAAGIDDKIAGFGRLLSEH